MFRKILTLFMVFALFTVQAHASTQNGLKAAFDELNYSLTVEWDQKDRAVYEAHMKKFNQTIRELQKQGLTNQEMIAFAKSKIKNAKVAKDLETAFTMVTINKMSSEEASQYMLDSMKRSYSNGASWNGEVVVYLVVGLLIVGLAIGIAAALNNSDDDDDSHSGSVGGVYTCYDDCYYYDYTCDYDWDGYPIYCEGYTCDEVCY